MNIDYRANRLRDFADLGVPFPSDVLSINRHGAILLKGEPLGGYATYPYYDIEKCEDGLSITYHKHNCCSDDYAVYRVLVKYDGKVNHHEIEHVIK